MSPQKHAAQIANAKLSHGPVTEAGRLRSRANGTRHGLASRKLRIIPPQDRDEFDELCSEMLPALAPEGPIENHLADLIVFDEWRLIRTRGLENEIFAMGFTKAKDEFFAGAEVWLAHSKELATLTLYEQRITRVLTRNKAEFESRQSARKASGAESGPDLLVCGTSVLHTGALATTQDQQPEAPPAEPAESEPVTTTPDQPAGFVHSSRVPSPTPAPQPLPPAAKQPGGFVRSSAAASSAPDAQLPNPATKWLESTPAIPKGALRNAA